MVAVAKKLKDTCFLDGSYDKPRQYIKKQKHHFANLIKTMIFQAIIYGCESCTIR